MTFEVAQAVRRQCTYHRLDILHRRGWTYVCLFARVSASQPWRDDSDSIDNVRVDPSRTMVAPLPNPLGSTWPTGSGGQLAEIVQPRTRCPVPTMGSSFAYCFDNGLSLSTMSLPRRSPEITPCTPCLSFSLVHQSEFEWRVSPFWKQTLSVTDSYLFTKWYCVVLFVLPYVRKWQYLLYTRNLHLACT